MVPSLTDWLMVAITFIYVCATILICIYNFKSTKAMRDQTAEMKRQFNENNRASVTVNFELIRNGLMAIRVWNQGNRMAMNVKVMISGCFLDRCGDEVKKQLEALSHAIFTLGSGQSWYFNLGSHLNISQLKDRNIQFRLSYEDNVQSYIEAVNIGFNEYFAPILYESPIEDLREEVKKGVTNLTNISRSIESIVERIGNNNKAHKVQE